jgi:hypothetical protein
MDAYRLFRIVAIAASVIAERGLQDLNAAMMIKIPLQASPSARKKLISMPELFRPGRIYETVAQHMQALLELQAKDRSAVIVGHVRGLRIRKDEVKWPVAEPFVPLQLATDFGRIARPQQVQTQQSPGSGVRFFS